MPEQTYSWAAQYEWDTPFAQMIPRVSGYYKDKVYTGLDPAAFIFEDEATLDAYTVWNARLGFKPHRVEGLEVALFVQNFTNEFYYGTGTVEAARLGVMSVVRGKPRNYGVDVFYRW